MKWLFTLMASLLMNGFLLSQSAAPQSLWHNKERWVHYLPDGPNFVCVRPKQRFNRALYGSSSAFRVEAGDLPEFAMYMPGMGGNLRFAIVKGQEKKWWINAGNIRAVYKPGSMVYTLKDDLLGRGEIQVTVLALSDAEGLVVKIEAQNVSSEVQLVWVFGGASGKKFSRDGDIGADPESSFYLKPENCLDNRYVLSEGKFQLTYGTGKALTQAELDALATPGRVAVAGVIPKEAKQINGSYPEGSVVRLIDAANPDDAFGNTATPISRPCITGRFSLQPSAQYLLLHNAQTPVLETAAGAFRLADAERLKLAGRIKIHTPDKYLNTLGGALSVAADAIWEAPSYLHGAVAWRMRLPGWRGAYAADALGWHDRASQHFGSYALSQITTAPTTGVVMDTALNLARHLEKVGTQLFSAGYISRNPGGDIRAHHYDMNLVFIDQLLNHFNYTGDTGEVKKFWPLIKRHLAWEKKNFDADGDGLYDAYAVIWASDALQYSGGGVTHSSAYNYRAFKTAARLARLIGEEGEAYEKEADKINNALKQGLWLKDRGWYAEYKDLLGHQLVHPSAGLWTIYHAIDSKLTDAFQQYQSLRYIDNNIPHIPVVARGWDERGLQLLSETNWQPYTWSLNNVVTSENVHTALAFWQGNRPEAAFQLFRSAMLESMYLSASPGNFQQLSFYDAMRGELYRDFADGIGISARALTEGLFGIQPDALNRVLTIKPGFPRSWNFAAFKTPDIDFDFKRKGLAEDYTITQDFPVPMKLQLVVGAFRDDLVSVTVNGKKVRFTMITDAVETPLLQINLPMAKKYLIHIVWKGRSFHLFPPLSALNAGESLNWKSADDEILGVYDPQQLLQHTTVAPYQIRTGFNSVAGNKTFFVKLRQGKFVYWQPVNLLLKTGETAVENAAVSPHSKLEKIDLSSFFNDAVTNIFRNRYLTPRPTSPTLQLPLQGIGNWAYPSVNFTVADSGFRAKAGTANEFRTSLDIPFQTPSERAAKNIVFTSLWDNYPDSVIIPVSGQASQAYLLMAGSTNPMQSRFVNGEVIINYTDQSADCLPLKNPENWWPVEQDYYEDGYAFTTNAPRPLRISLKTGLEIPVSYRYSAIKGFSNYAIEGGAATLLEMPVNKNKTIKNMVVKAVANDVVIGLMGITLRR